MADWFAGTVSSGSLLLAVPMAVLAGLVSFFSPCVVPLLPGYLSYMSGVAVQDLQHASRWRLVLGALLFVAGFGAVFVAGGAAFGAVGLRLNEHQRLLSVVMGIVVILLGLAFMGLVPALQREWRVHAVPAVGLGVAPLLGVLFGVGWIPCIGPTLGAVLVLAGNEATAGRGALLTATYALGLGIPFVLAALGFARFTRTVGWFRRHQRGVSLFGGGLLVLVGVLLVTGVWDAVVRDLQGWVQGTDVLL